MAVAITPAMIATSQEINMPRNRSNRERSPVARSSSDGNAQWRAKKKLPVVVSTVGTESTPDQSERNESVRTTGVVSPWAVCLGRRWIRSEHRCSAVGGCRGQSARRRRRTRRPGLGSALRRSRDEHGARSLRTPQHHHPRGGGESASSELYRGVGRHVCGGGARRGARGGAGLSLACLLYTSPSPR